MQRDGLHPNAAGARKVEALVMKAAEAKDASNAEPGNAVLRARAELLAAQEEIRSRTVRDELLEYVSKLIRATRER